MVKQYMSNNHPKNRNNYPPVDSNPAGWSCEQVRRWVTAAGFADCAQRLMDEVGGGGGGRRRLDFLENFSDFHEKFFSFLRNLSA